MVGACIVVCLLLFSCFEIVKINQPDQVQVGEEFTVEIEAQLTGQDGNTLIFGFLAPRAWQPAEHTTVSFESTVGGGTMSLIDPDEVEADNNQPWVQAITERVGIGSNYGEVIWTVFKADMDVDPSGISEENPATGTITLKTKAGETNLISQLGYFMGEAVWGFLNDGTNSTFEFYEECIEVIGASGSAQNLCGPAPRQLISLPTFDFNDILTITFDATEDETELIGAEQVHACLTAVTQQGGIDVCDPQVTSMSLVGPDVWQMTIWPPSFFGLSEDDTVAEILVNFQDANGATIVRDVSGNDFQILAKCF